VRSIVRVFLVYVKMLELLLVGLASICCWKDGNLSFLVLFLFLLC
jgi:hypothetical protein